MKMPGYYRNLPVGQKVQMAGMLVGLIATLLGSASLLIDGQIQGRDGIRRDVEVLAEIFSANSTAALTFNDPYAARELLATLQAKQHITAAYLYSADGKLFARYRRDAGLGETAPPPLLADGSRFDSRRLTVFKSILSGGQKIGTVALESDLGELSSRLQHFLWVVFVVILGRHWWPSSSPPGCSARSWSRSRTWQRWPGWCPPARTTARAR
jgi:Periplasmic sensor domain